MYPQKSCIQGPQLSKTMDDFSLVTVYLGTVNISQCGAVSKADPACFLFGLQPPSSSGGQCQQSVLLGILRDPMQVTQREVTTTWYLDLLELCLKTYDFELQRGLSIKDMYCS